MSRYENDCPLCGSATEGGPKMSLLQEILDEAAKADAEYGFFASMHEGYGVLAEEVQELLEAIRMKRDMLASNGHNRGQCIRAEAIQVAAVAFRMAMQAERVDR